MNKNHKLRSDTNLGPVANSKRGSQTGRQHPADGSGALQFLFSQLKIKIGNMSVNDIVRCLCLERNPNTERGRSFGLLSVPRRATAPLARHNTRVKG